MSTLIIQPADFAITTIEDEIRVDGLCRDLLMEFYEELQAEGGDPEIATELARSADYFVRDFVVGFKQWHLFDEARSPVRPFAGNWYIVNTLDPASGELAKHLAGILAYYRFMARHKLISATFLERVEAECNDHPFYEERIKSFWEISGDGYYVWEQACPVRGA
jgi:hypothetical protein